MTVSLQPLTHLNWEQAIKLTVRPDQAHFVTPNLYSIAESQFPYHHHDGTVWPNQALAIYNDEEMIGFAMYQIEQAKRESAYIVRVMIDQAHQGKGYGKTAFGLLLARIKTEAGPKCQHIGISYEPSNDVARKLYAHFGFVETGEIEHGEVVAGLSLLPTSG